MHAQAAVRARGEATEAKVAAMDERLGVVDDKLDAILRLLQQQQPAREVWGGGGAA